MTKSPLIYRCGPRLILIDPEFERRIGYYENYSQAERAWAAYMAQGRVGQGFDLYGYDEYVIDRWREDSQQFIAKCEVRR
jgi:hypothetical protein